LEDLKYKANFGQQSSTF